MTTATVGRISAATLKEQIIQKAWAEPAFKQSLLANPKQAIYDAFGIEIPAQYELHVAEETPTRYVLTIPPKPEDFVAQMKPTTEVVW